METPPITITTQDLQRLSQIVSSYQTSTSEQLDIELARAHVVSQREIDRDVVTMNSDVIYEDATAGTQRHVRIVYPKDANADRGWVSVLAPLGVALLGLRVGQAIEWQLPNGPHHLRVIDVPYQPEANGDFSL